MSHSVIPFVGSLLRQALPFVMLGAGFAGSAQGAIRFDDITSWVGSGSNSAALVIDWNDGKNDSSLVWGYHWDGTATGEQMLNAVIAADPKLYASISSPTAYGDALFGLGYDTTSGDTFSTTPALEFVDRIHINPSYNGNDGIAPTNPADHWQSGWYSGYWSYWVGTGLTPAWGYSGLGMSGRVLANGDWDGWSYSDFASPGAGGSPRDPVPASVPEPAGMLVFAAIGGACLLGRRRRKAAALVLATVGAGFATQPRSANAAYVYNADDFATEVVSYTGPVDPRAAYNDPSAVLGRPALTFNNSFNPNVQDIRVSKIVEPPFNYGPNGSTLITVLPNSPDIATLTVKMGRPVTDDPNHPYGADLIVFGNSFYVGGSNGNGGFVSDDTNLNDYTVTGGIYAHPVQVSVSPDNVNWFTFPTLSGIQPYNAYRWDAVNETWTAEALDPTLPLDPSVYTTDFAGQSVADILAAYGDSAGGTGLDLADALDGDGRTLVEDGFNSIQYVRFASTASDYTAISGVAAVPEPATLAVLTLAGLAMLRRRRA